MYFASNAHVTQIIGDCYTSLSDKYLIKDEQAYLLPWLEYNDIYIYILTKCGERRNKIKLIEGPHEGERRQGHGQRPKHPHQQRESNAQHPVPHHGHGEPPLQHGLRVPRRRRELSDGVDQEIGVHEEAHRDGAAEEARDQEDGGGGVLEGHDPSRLRAEKLGGGEEAVGVEGVVGEGGEGQRDDDGEGGGEDGEH